MTRIAGVRLATAAAGIRYKNRDDIVVIEMTAGGTCAGLFTRNAFCAAPVTVARESPLAGRRACVYAADSIRLSQAATSCTSRPSFDPVP